MKSGFYQAVEEIFVSQGLAVSENQLHLFERFFQLLTEKNKVMNLTRITSPQEAAEKHFFDSVSVLKYFDWPQGARIIDIGTGPGFPAIPLKIMRPDMTMTAIDSSGKKTAFVAEAAKELGLDIETVSARAEELAADPQYRESYDYALSRAVASLPILLELCIPFVKPNGFFIAWKGADYKNELASSQTALENLKTTQKEIFFPFADRQHALMVFQKNEPTSGIFPRKFSQIKNRPL